MVKVRLSTAEKVKIEARAMNLGVSVQRLLVEAALATNRLTLTERRSHVIELMALRRLVTALSNNLNQLARVANASGNVPRAFGPTSAAIARAANRLDAAVATFMGEGQ
ncbi:hypothetical protein ACFQX6_67630 [Streptosporangium lutulentum]